MILDWFVRSAFCKWMPEMGLGLESENPGPEKRRPNNNENDATHSICHQMQRPAALDPLQQPTTGLRQLKSEIAAHKGTSNNTSTTTDYQVSGASSIGL